MSINDLFPPENSLPSSRAEAKAIGSTFYWTGKPCSRGHVAKRYACDAACIECYRIKIASPKAKTRKKRYYIENKEKINAANKANRLKNLERERDRSRKRREKNLEHDAQVKKAWALKNRDRLKEYHQEWYAANQDKHRQYQKARNAENPHPNRERVKKWRIENPDQYLASKTSWQERNKERVATYFRNRRARKRNAEGRHTKDDTRRIREEQHDMCAACGVDLAGKGHLDHIIPLSKGGSNWPDNLQWLCEPCNLSKSNKSHEDFMRSLQLNRVR